MFQIGFFEILIILIIGIIFVGPQKLPQVVKFFVKTFRTIQKNISAVKDEIESEIKVDEIKQDIHNELKLKELEELDNQNGK